VGWGVLGIGGGAREWTGVGVWWGGKGSGAVRLRTNMANIDAPQKNSFNAR